MIFGNMQGWKTQIIKKKLDKIEIKYLNKMRENQFLKIKNSLLEIEKDFIELKEN